MIKKITHPKMASIWIPQNTSFDKRPNSHDEPFQKEWKNMANPTA
jgi:hypothetical protein